MVKPSQNKRKQIPLVRVEANGSISSAIFDDHHNEPIDISLPVNFDYFREWLKGATSFRFELHGLDIINPDPSYTARRESDKYWIAYKHCSVPQKHMRKIHIGKSEDVSLDRLLMVARNISLDYEQWLASRPSNYRARGVSSFEGYTSNLMGNDHMAQNGKHTDVDIEQPSLDDSDLRDKLTTAIHAVNDLSEKLQTYIQALSDRDAVIAVKNAEIERLRGELIKQQLQTISTLGQ